MNEIEILGTKIQYDAGNVRIVDSYKIKEKDMLDILFKFRVVTGYNGKRTIFSWLKEWKVHNRLYKLGLFRSHTADCDLEENEKLHRLIAYEILGI